MPAARLPGLLALGLAAQQRLAAAAVVAAARALGVAEAAAHVAAAGTEAAVPGAADQGESAPVPGFLLQQMGQSASMVQPNALSPDSPPGALPYAVQRGGARCGANRNVSPPRTRAIPSPPP